MFTCLFSESLESELDEIPSLIESLNFCALFFVLFDNLLIAKDSKYGKRKMRECGRAHCVVSLKARPESFRQGVCPQYFHWKGHEFFAPNPKRIPRSAA